MQKSKTVLYDFAKTVDLERRLILSYFAVFEMVTVGAPNKVGLHDSKCKAYQN